MPTISYTPPATCKAFIKHFKPGQLFADWIIGPVGPLSGDTEFLTPTGWKRMDAYADGDHVAQWSPNGALTFVPPDDYIVTPATEMLHFHNRYSLSMVLSPCHRLVYYDYRDQLQEAPAGYVAQHRSDRRIPTTFTPTERPGTGLSEAVLRLAVAIHADGHFPASNPNTAAHPSYCAIVVRKGRKKERLRTLLAGAGVEYREVAYPQRPTETHFRFRSPYVGKHYDARWWGATAAELEIVLAEMQHWDGLFEGVDTRFSTAHKSDADFIQYAAHACGGRATISAQEYPQHDEWAPTYTVHIAPRGSTKAAVYVREGTQVDRVPAPGGRQYCFRTPASYFLARHNGRVFITGNSGKTTSNFFKLVYMASLQAKSPIDGKRHVRAVVVRNTAPQLRDTTITSWMYWFKDREAGTWRATETKFILRYADVECEVLFRPLDTPDDVSRVLSLEVTFAILDEFVEIKKEIVEALSARVGRYPPTKDGGATNWGMWGASNPGNEDDWWYPALYGSEDGSVLGADHFDWTPEERALHRNERNLAGLPPESTWTYFEQPSGFTGEAENVENLPGGKAYYTSLAKDKTPQWVHQYIEVQWGYSISGQPVIATFNPEIHIAKKPLMFNPGLMLCGGLDPGMNSAMIFGQQNHFGQLYVTSELVTTGYGAKRFCNDKLKPHLRQSYPAADFVISPDPAATQRAQTDERTVVDVFKKDFKIKIPTMNNRLPGRIEAIEHFTTRITENGPALLIDPRCKHIIRALRSGWRYSTNTKGDTAEIPKKNAHSHPGDAFSYLCQFFYRLDERTAKNKDAKRMPVFRNPYLAR